MKGSKPAIHNYYWVFAIPLQEQRRSYFSLWETCSSVTCSPVFFLFYKLGQLKQTHRNTLHVTVSTFTPTMKMWKSQSIIAVMSTTVFPCIWTFHHWGVYPTVTACWLSYCRFIAVLTHFEDISWLQEVKDRSSSLKQPFQRERDCKFVAHSCNQNWCFKPTLKEESSIHD